VTTTPERAETAGLSAGFWRSFRKAVFVYGASVANRALLLVMDKAQPPGEYEPSASIRGANYSVPLLWLSLFDLSSLVAWPSTLGDTSTYTALVGTMDVCTARSRRRVDSWRSLWGSDFGATADSWLGILEGGAGSFVAVWTEEISDMSGDMAWAQMLRSYLDGIDEVLSVRFAEALRQSYLEIDSTGTRLQGSNGTALDLALIGYPWS
jgi:hypothetical protein